MKKLIITLTFLIAAAWWYNYSITSQFPQMHTQEIPIALTRQEIKPEEAETTATPEIASITTSDVVEQPKIEKNKVESSEMEEVKDIPITFNLKIPFTPQAPHANWDMPYQEACEEASILMAHWFVVGEEKTADQADHEIKELVAWETEHLGFYQDTTIEETLRIIHERFGYTESYMIQNPTIEEIKNVLAKGYPVLLPAAGKLLDNPYFSGDGPLYHMMVLRGYTDTHFITNDPGTRRGEGYTYKQQHLMDVMHDWNNGDVENGRKAVIVVKY